jgi:adenylate cyclase
VLHHPEALRPGGQRREITVLFSDIRNFTTISERRDPALVSELLNLYLEAMAGCIVRHGGVIDKFIGDGILAFFGAPVAQADHARRALASARDMLSALNTVRSVWRERGVDELRIGIGLHTGEAIVGNLGSAERLDYTVIGDTVNTASRVESATKDLKVSLLFTAATRTRLGPETSCQAMGCISVKGREQALEVFTLEEPGKDPRMVQS